MSNKLAISLDSTTFRDIDFIEWLQLKSNDFQIFISIIVYLETFHWYNLRGISKSLFDMEINALNAFIIDLKQSDTELISNNAILSNLLFKHHARDIIIGTQSAEKNAQLITLNKKHFSWMRLKTLTPEEFLEEQNIV